MTGKEVHNNRNQAGPAQQNIIIPLESLTLADEVRELRSNYEFMVTYLQQQIHLKRLERSKLIQKLDQRNRIRYPI